MDHRTPSYLRPNRRRWALTQRDLAYLVGMNSPAVISRIEKSTREPSISVLIACAIIFGTTPSELFPAIATNVQQTVLRRANELYEALQGNGSKRTKLKLDFLESLLSRLEENNASQV